MCVVVVWVLSSVEECLLRGGATLTRGHWSGEDYSHVS